jgi:hypothetical protein
MLVAFDVALSDLSVPLWESVRTGLVHFDTPYGGHEMLSICQTSPLRVAT